MKKADIPTSYGGIIIPWHGKLTSEMILTTVYEEGSLRYALPKGKPKKKESPMRTAIRESSEETGIPEDELFSLIKQPITDYVRLSRDNKYKRIILWLMMTHDHGPYLPQTDKHPFAEAIPLSQVSAYLHNPEDSMQIVGIHNLMEEIVDRMKGVARWNGYFSEHRKQALELQKNMIKFYSHIAATLCYH